LLLLYLFKLSRNGLRDYEGVAIVWVVVVLEHKVWMGKGTKLRRRRDIRKNRQGFHEEHSKGQPVPIIKLNIKVVEEKAKP
jgi:tRNA (Thr-GGU) A37 N-methylase